MSKPPLTRAEIERRLTAAAAMPDANLREIEALGMCRWLAKRAEAYRRYGVGCLACDLLNHGCDGINGAPCIDRVYEVDDWLDGEPCGGEG